ncbi:sorting nexin-7 isoform X1 [Mesocricetus auratus]|uniref:Sorting nexin-7 isoform X1 n=1 Tax=Mesocricetus auratus TaxID=10036 RepID=A0ABM2XZF0_MESAU|nr:sorting nexin-7 isoform X1 [Mesocricetus auratus]
MDGERLASGSSELAVGESPRGGAPIPDGSGSCSLLQADVLDLDEDEDDLEVFSKDASLMDMNSFSPMMPTSPLSMINQIKFEDESDLKDLFITVDAPESHVTTIETFITYRIITKTSRGEFDSSEFEVRRRYQDFLWLKGKLEEAHPTLIIPPLPEKFIVKGMVERFNDDFIETRRKALHKFLNRIADHPTLTFNEDFKVFLTAQAPELSSYKKQGPSLLSRMGQTVRAVASSMRGVKNRPDEFMEMNNFIETFSQKINLIDKISQRIYKEERDYLDEMKEFGPIHILWSASEEDLADTLKGIASCIDQCCKATEKRMTGLSEALLPVVHEYVLYSEMLMGVMKRRDQIQTELDSKVEALTYRKADADLLTEEIGKLEDKVECANNALKADWERWKQNMQNDLKSAFTDTAEENIRYYEQDYLIPSEDNYNVENGDSIQMKVEPCGWSSLGCISLIRLAGLILQRLRYALLHGNHSSHHRLTSPWKRTLKIKFNPIDTSCLIFERQHLSTKVVFFWIGCALYKVDDK